MTEYEFASPWKDMRTLGDTPDLFGAVVAWCDHEAGMSDESRGPHQPNTAAHIYYQLAFYNGWTTSLNGPALVKYVVDGIADGDGYQPPGWYTQDDNGAWVVAAFPVCYIDAGLPRAPHTSPEQE